MITATLQEAEGQLADLIEQAVAGEEVLIVRAGKPSVRIMVIQPDQSAAPTAKRELFGALRGQVWMADDDEMARVDAEIARLFEGDESADLPAAAE